MCSNPGCDYYRDTPAVSDLAAFVADRIQESEGDIFASMDYKDHGEVFLKYQAMFILGNFSLCTRLW